MTHHEEEVVLTMLSLSLTWLLLQSRGVHQLISACVMSNIHNGRKNCASCTTSKCSHLQPPRIVLCFCFYFVPPYCRAHALWAVRLLGVLLSMGRSIWLEVLETRATHPIVTAVFLLAAHSCDFERPPLRAKCPRSWKIHEPGNTAVIRLQNVHS